MIDQVLKSTKYVVENSTQVSIDLEAVRKLCKKVKRKDLSVSEIRLAKYEWPFETFVELVFLFNTLNFCFFSEKGKEKWTVIVNGEELDGALALFRVLENEAKKQGKILEGTYLRELKLNELKRILAGKVEIPLLPKRLGCLNEAGKILEEKFGGRFFNLFKSSKQDAVQMAELLIRNFRKFNDTAVYRGMKIHFYKRAQLNSKMISDTLVLFGKSPLKRLNELTAFADYKIPQILRILGILKYSKLLADKIDSFQIIPSQSREEIEIRSATVWAVEYLRQALSTKFPYVTPSHIDGMLWNLAQNLDRDKTPYHRTYTTAY